MARAPQAEGLVANYGNGFSTEIFARFQHSQEFWDVSDTPICRHSPAMQLLGDLPPWRLALQQHAHAPLADNGSMHAWNHTEAASALLASTCKCITCRINFAWPQTPWFRHTVPCPWQQVPVPICPDSAPRAIAVQVTVITGTGEWKLHSLLLASRSEFFYRYGGSFLQQAARATFTSCCHCQLSAGILQLNSAAAARQGVARRGAAVETPTGYSIPGAEVVWWTCLVCAPGSTHAAVATCSPH